MQTRLFVLLAILLVPGTSVAEPERLTFDQLLARSQRSSRAEMAKADTEAARARVDEADAARMPTLSATAFVAPSPDIDCIDASCTETDPQDFALRLSGAFGGGSLSITQPLYTFGKIGAARAAARAGVDAQAALEDELAGDLAVECARAYYGLKLARTLRYMLEDGVAEITEAGTRLEERLADKNSGATIQDRQRLQTLLAEAKAQLTDARAAEATALAAVRAIAGDDTATLDIDEEELEAVEAEVPDEDATVAEAKTDRAQVRAADAGARAADRLVDLEAASYWPDLALYGSLGYTNAMGVEDAPSAVYSEPYHQKTGAIALVLRWNLAPWTTHAKVKRARAAADKAHELSDLARTGATMDAHTASSDAREAQERVTAATEGEEASRAWVASVLQADAIGTAETRDLADSYIAWFQMRARLATAIFQWNVAVVRLGRATGEFTAGGARRKETQ
jgi:HAE1 family hydrophobic/amphiphilic exporter-1